MGSNLGGLPLTAPGLLGRVYSSRLVQSPGQPQPLSTMLPSCPGVLWRDGEHLDSHSVPWGRVPRHTVPEAALSAPALLVCALLCWDRLSAGWESMAEANQEGGAGRHQTPHRMEMTGRWRQIGSGQTSGLS